MIIPNIMNEWLGHAHMHAMTMLAWMCLGAPVALQQPRQLLIGCVSPLQCRLIHSNAASMVSMAMVGPLSKVHGQHTHT